MAKTIVRSCRIDEMDLPDFHLLCGFLGSGKTSLISETIAQKQFANTGVIINEVGEINIDGATISSTTSGLRIAQMSNGCVCCSLQGDLPFTVAALMDAHEERGDPPLERIILETSGLSRPAPILRNLLGLPIPFRVHVVATYDCSRNVLGGLGFEEAVAQIAGAQTILLTKLDCASAEQIKQSIAATESVNPLARIVQEPLGSARPAFTFVRPEARANLALPSGFVATSAALDHERARVFLVKPVAGDWSDVLVWLSDLAGFCGERLLRSKGIVRPDEAGPWLLVQSVGTVFDTPRPIDKAYDFEPGVVVIARDISVADLEALPTETEIAIKILRSG
jgi:G3E family GTPase